MSSSENIKNAFEVVRRTYENVDKLMKHCDNIAKDCGYLSVSDKFLRYKSDLYNGWLINSFIKLYRLKSNKILKNEWKDGSIFAMEISFEDTPKVYLSKFECDNISNFTKGTISPAMHWIFSDPVDSQGGGFIPKGIGDKDGYYFSKPETENMKSKYRGINRVVYTTSDLLQLNSNNVTEKVFGEFDTLRSFPD